MTLSKNEQTVFYFLFVILVCTVWWTEITLEDLFWFSPLATFLQFLDMIFKKKYFDHILSNYRTEIVLRNEKKIKCWYILKYVCEKKSGIFVGNAKFWPDTGRDKNSTYISTFSTVQSPYSIQNVGLHLLQIHDEWILMWMRKNMSKDVTKTFEFHHINIVLVISWKCIF